MKLFRGNPCRSLYSLYFGLILVFVPFLTLLTIYTGNVMDTGPAALGTSVPGGGGGGGGRPSSSDGGGGGEGPSNVRRPDVELSLGHKIVELKERLIHVEMVNQERKVQLQALRRQLNSNGSSSSSNYRPWNSHLSGGDQMVDYELLQLPTLYRFMPHLAKNGLNPLRPAYRRISRRLGPTGRQGASIVFGMPTVKRPVESYLMTTIRSLVENLSPEEEREAVIVVFIAETDAEFVQKTASTIEEEFGVELESGLIEIIAPPAGYYPDLSTGLKSTLGDPLPRVRWRTKQNLDFAYLMMYCQQKGTFYVQLEDDIITKPAYFRKMKTFALKQSLARKEWLIIDFCSLGFIGKMVKSVDLSTLILFFVIFQNDKPVDWLLSYIAQTKYCRIDQDNKACRMIISKHWLQYRPSLFQHIGTHSSLKGKIQKLREKGFGKQRLFHPHRENPPAEAWTSMQAYKTFTIQSAYNGESYFWGMNPSAGDELGFEFQPPIKLDRFLIRSGNFEHVADMLMDASVQVMPIHEPTGGEASNGLYNRTTGGYFTIGHFPPETGISHGPVPLGLGPIKRLKIQCHANLTNWVILSEISIVPL